MEINGVRWNYDRYEVIADGVVHGIGVVFALIGVTALIFYATVWATSGQLAAAWVYGVGLVLSLAISFAYNVWPVSKVKWHLRRFDHSAIFVLIAATYTPFLVKGAHDWVILSLLVGIWATAFVGITLKCRYPGRYDRLAILLYLAMGWVGVIAGWPLFSTMSGPVLGLIVAGGIIYTAGTLFYLMESLPFHTTIWHVFVLTATVVFFAAVTLHLADTAVPGIDGVRDLTAPAALAAPGS